ncbi:MAG: hypothetical protein ACJ72N_20580 [Labedaea sp.]
MPYVPHRPALRETDVREVYSVRRQRCRTVGSRPITIAAARPDANAPSTGCAHPVLGVF